MITIDTCLPFLFLAELHITNSFYKRLEIIDSQNGNA